MHHAYLELFCLLSFISRIAFVSIKTSQTESHKEQQCHPYTDLYKRWPETAPTLPLQYILTHTHTHIITELTQWVKYGIVTGAIRERRNRELEGSFSESVFWLIPPHHCLPHQHQLNHILKTCTKMCLLEISSPTLDGVWWEQVNQSPRPL